MAAFGPTPVTKGGSQWDCWGPFRNSCLVQQDMSSGMRPPPPLASCVPFFRLGKVSLVLLFPNHKKSISFFIPKFSLNIVPENFVVGAATGLDPISHCSTGEGARNTAHRLVHDAALSSNWLGFAIIYCRSRCHRTIGLHRRCNAVHPASVGGSRADCLPSLHYRTCTVLNSFGRR